jgi:amino acid transporter
LKKISLIPLIGIIYFTVSGGAFGLEELVSSAGPGLALLLLIVTPLLWSLPVALMVSEMSSMLPLHGGYYRWVYFALGRFWGFQQGWWIWIFTFVDMAIYPVLFADYARYFFPDLAGWQHWIVCLLVIYSSLAINLLGAHSVGRSSVLAFVIINIPFLLFTILGLSKIQHAPWVPWTPGNENLIQTIGLGLAVVIWNYSGWDNVSTFAGEVDNPKRNYPLALMISVPLITLLYLFPIGVGVATTENWSEWQTGDIAKVAGQVVGPWLGAMMSLGVMFSVWSLFNSQLLYTSRLPFAMAEDGFFPKWIARRNSRWGTPHLSLLTCALIYSLFTLMDFKKLVVINVLIYSAALLLQFFALIKLRRHRPELPRPFRIPGGRAGLILATGTVVIFALTCLIFFLLGTGESWKQVVVAAGMLLTGPLIYEIATRVLKQSPENEVWLRELDHSPDRD